MNNIPFDRYINIFQEDENAQKSDHIVGNTKTNIDCWAKASNDMRSSSSRQL